jgi:hypothetical protein
MTIYNEYILTLFAGFFISFALTIETFGSLMRSIGALNNRPAIGYSTHVRIATIGRVFILFAAPAIGLLVDRYNDPILVLLVGLICFFVATILHALLFYFQKYFEDISANVFFLFNKSFFQNTIVFHNTFFNIYKLKLFSLIAISIQSGGLFFVNILAAFYPDYRATLVQMAGFITFLGTACHIFFVDPVLAEGCDQREFSRSVISIYIYGRMLGCLINFAMITFILFIMYYNV